MDEVGPREGGGLGSKSSTKIRKNHDTSTHFCPDVDMHGKDLDLNKFHSFAKGHFGRLAQ